MSTIAPNVVRSFLGRYLINDVLDIVPDFRNSYGSHLVDRKDGRVYLDCISHFASNPVGHNHPGLDDQAFMEKLIAAARHKPANSDFYSVEMAEFVEVFSRFLMPKEFVHLFFVEGGTLAVENALKVAFDWKCRLNLSRGRAALGSQVIHFREAFHGRGGYTLSLTNTADLRKTNYFPKFSWPRIVNPKLSFPLDEAKLQLVIETEQEAKRQIQEALAASPNDIAAIIIEPIQGEGGDNHFRSEFHRHLRKVADEHEVMLIYDEVQTGVGLTGRRWAYEHWASNDVINDQRNFCPDILVFGKKTQVCGIMVGSKVDLVCPNVFQESSRINSTWGGALVDMVRCSRYLQIIENEKLVENASRVGDLLLAALERLSQKFSSLVSNARGLGLMCAIDLPSAELRSLALDALFKEGLLVISCGQSSIRFRPSLNFSLKDVEEVEELLHAAFGKLVARGVV